MDTRKAHVTISFECVLKYGHYSTFKEDMSNLIISLNQTLIFEWPVVRYGSNDGYQKDWTMCLKYIDYYKLNS